MRISENTFYLNTYMSRNVSQYFNQVGAKNEQRLAEDLIIEAIRISGMRVYYAPRSLINFDSVFGEDNMSIFFQGVPDRNVF